jgi:hypothetical protein
LSLREAALAAVGKLRDCAVCCGRAQAGATMGKWFGLSDTQLLDIFPNLSAFDASRRNLAFMTA